MLQGRKLVLSEVLGELADALTINLTTIELQTF